MPQTHILYIKKYALCVENITKIHLVKWSRTNGSCYWSRLSDEYLNAKHENTQTHTHTHTHTHAHTHTRNATHKEWTEPKEKKKWKKRLFILFTIPCKKRETEKRTMSLKYFSNITAIILFNIWNYFTVYMKKNPSAFIFSLFPTNWFGYLAWVLCSSSICLPPTIAYFFYSLIFVSFQIGPWPFVPPILLSDIKNHENVHKQKAKGKMTHTMKTVSTYAYTYTQGTHYLSMSVRVVLPFISNKVLW